jgi:hypothetical protein
VKPRQKEKNPGNDRFMAQNNQGLKWHVISSIIARYSIFRGSTLNFCNFARYHAICKIICYIALNLPIIITLFFPDYCPKRPSFLLQKKKLLSLFFHDDELQYVGFSSESENNIANGNDFY